MNILTNGLVIFGACFLALALAPARGIIKQLPQGSVQRRWKILVLLILFFIVGYIGYAIVSWNSYGKFSDLLVPAIFFFGALFVLLVNTISLQAALDVKRISTLEIENITDPLTGIHNRRYLDRRLDEEFARAHRYGLPLSIFLLDIDHFKRINDTFGHQIGDSVLVNIGRLIQKTVRQADIVARYGGEEILVIATNTSSSDAITLAERVRQKVGTSVMASAKQEKVHQNISVTVSIGVAAIGPAIVDSHGLIASADKALYLAKQGGRNRVVFDNNLNNDHRHE